MRIEAEQNANGFNGALFGDHTIMEGGHISRLKSCGQVLFPWCPLWWWWCACLSLELAHQLSGRVVPCTSCLHGRWVEGVSAK